MMTKSILHQNKRLAGLRRFPLLKELYAKADLPRGEDSKSTAIAQPAIVTSSITGLKILNQLGINADISIGHSLGELSALHWASVFDETALIRIAKKRGKAMAELGNPTGKMASIGAGEREVQGLLNGGVVGIAGFNSPYQTIVSGEAIGINEIVEKARAKGLKTFTLPVSHAFHVIIHSPPCKTAEILDFSLEDGGECERLLSIALLKLTVYANLLPKGQNFLLPVS
jgi:enediyne polyketide synthase